MPNSTSLYDVTLTREDGYPTAEVTTVKGEDVSAEKLFELARAVEQLAKLQLNKEHAKHLVLNMCYSYRTKFGLAYVQYVGVDNNGILVQPINADGSIKDDASVQHFHRRADTLTEMAVQPVVQS